LRLVAGDLACELLLAGRRVLPAKAQANGFEFRYPTLASALVGLFGRETPTQARIAVPLPDSAATCLAGENTATTSTALARVVSPPLDSPDCIGGSAHGVELA
jgi:hypothetical protein